MHPSDGELSLNAVDNLISVVIQKTNLINRGPNQDKAIKKCLRDILSLSLGKSQRGGIFKYLQRSQFYKSMNTKVSLG